MSVRMDAEGVLVNIYRRIAVSLLLVAMIATVLPTAPAAAAMKSWTVRVIKVNDGDTIDVDSNFDGRIDYKVRLIGINTAEGHWKYSKALRKRIWVTPEKPKCHSWTAYLRLRKLVEGKKVILKAQSATSIGADNRKLRYVHRISDGKDLNALMLREGRAVAYPNEKEKARNALYNRIAKSAANRKIGMWNPFACRDDGPYAGSPTAYLRVRPRWVVEGDKQLNNEYVRIENTHQTMDVTLTGWVLRESSSRYYFFNSGVKVLAGGSITVHSGSGVDDTDSVTPTLHKHVYAKNARGSWGSLSQAVFGQERSGIYGRKHASRPGFRDSLPVQGDGAYLYDPDRDLRAYSTFPCITSTNKTCADPKLNASKVRVEVNWAGSNDAESVEIKNISGAEISLDGYVIDSWPYNTEIRPGTKLQAGETLVVNNGPGSGGLDQGWNGPSNADMFWCKEGDRNDYLELRRLEGHVAYRWQCFP